jgi:hypothetical protein
MIGFSNEMTPAGSLVSLLFFPEEGLFLDAAWVSPLKDNASVRAKMPVSLRTKR